MKDQNRNPTTLMTVEELMNTTSTKWLVPGLLPDKGVAVLWGTPRAGKTFVALEIALSIARGTPVFGRPAAQAPICYLSFEGTLRHRVQAYMKHHALSVADLVEARLLMDPPISFLNAENVSFLIDILSEFRAAHGRLGLVVVDTLNRAMSGGDESGPDMALAVDAATQVARELGCMVLFVHHAGKDVKAGPRGHTALTANTDVSVQVMAPEKRGGMRTLHVHKVRDAESDYAAAWFDLMRVSLPRKHDHEIGSSCVVDVRQASLRQGHQEMVEHGNVMTFPEAVA